MISCVLCAVGSCAPWFSLNTTLVRGDLGGWTQGGLVTLVLSMLSLLLIAVAPKLVGPVMALAMLYALTSAYFRPGGLAMNYGGGEALIAWGLVLVIAASALAVMAAFARDRHTVTPSG